MDYLGMVMVTCLMAYQLSMGYLMPKSNLFENGLVGFYGISTLVGYLMPNPLYTYILDIRGAYDKFPDFFRKGTFIDSTRMKL